MARRLKVVGFDPSMSNWGMAIGSYDLDTRKLVVDHVDVTCPEPPKGKQVRQNSKDLQASQQLAAAAVVAARGAHAIFVEVPHGSQSARAMASYGMCVGILGTLRAGGISFFEVNASEVKQATGLKKTATKEEMIAWAVAKHPEANWTRHTHDSKGKPSKSNPAVMVGAYKKGDLTGINEHMADAVAAIYAGLATSSFQQLLPMLAAQT